MEILSILPFQFLISYMKLEAFPIYWALSNSNLSALSKESMPIWGSYLSE